MFEIGSEFWSQEYACGSGIEEFLPSSFHINYTLCGRTALDIVIEDCLREIACKSVYMPSYCCHTMIDPFVKHGIKVVFYDVVADNKGITALYEDNSCDIVFLIDYFGFIQQETLQFAKVEKAKGKIIIYDSTQSFFCDFDKESYFDYVFGSFKKWFGVNAGFAAKKNEWSFFPKLVQNDCFISLRNTAFKLKSDYIKNPDGFDKSVFLTLFSEAERLLESDYKYYGPDEQSLRLLSSIEVSELRSRRKRNASVLINRLLGEQGIRVLCSDVMDNECPLFVPICVEGCRDDLKNYLIQKRIYLPVHWPGSGLHSLSANSSYLYGTELSCVCDQRYSVSDMEAIGGAIDAFYAETKRGYSL